MRWLLLIVLAVACRRDDAPTPTPGSQADLRIVSLTPSATEVVAALGSTSQLVGVDEYSTFPAEVKALPKVGSFLTPNLEAIVRLKPSFVIIDDVHGNTAGALHDAKIETVECAIHGLPDVKQALRTVGKRLGKAAAAERAIDSIEKALDSAAAKRAGKRPRVLAIIDRETSGLGNLIAAGPGSWLDELLAVSGAENVLSSSGIRYPKVSMEEVLRAQPDVIIDVSEAGQKGDVAAWNAVDVPAAKTGRVRGLADQFLLAPSPRVEQALAVLAKAIAAP